MDEISITLPRDAWQEIIRDLDNIPELRDQLTMALEEAERHG